MAAGYGAGLLKIQVSGPCKLLSSLFLDVIQLTHALYRADDAITDVVFNIGSILFPLGMSIIFFPPQMASRFLIRAFFALCSRLLWPNLVARRFRRPPPLPRCDYYLESHLRPAYPQFDWVLGPA